MWDWRSHLHRQKSKQSNVVDKSNDVEQKEGGDMALARRNPAELEWPGWFPSRLFDWPEAWRSLTEEPSLKLEEFREGDNVVVRAEMPGLDPEKDVEITITDNVLRIRAERREETKTEDKEGYRTEFRYGSFSRAIRLPAGATEQDVNASYTDGILEVRVPINTTEAEAKKIAVKRG
jgi:HSP20 family protein